MTLTEFLEARISEDEAAARADAAEMDRSGVSIQFDCDTQARFTPSRVLAECAAKRAVLAEHAPVDPCDAHDAIFNTIPCDTLRHLAAVYADHPDYQQEWA